MASFLQRIILITLILTIAIPISIGHREKSENESDWEDDSEPDIDSGRDDSEIGRYLRDLCSDTKKSKQCWKIIKPEIARFTDTNSRNVAIVIIDLATAKSDEIQDKLKQFHHDSGDHELKKYNSCSKNYKDANHGLKIVKGNLNYDNYQEIHARINDVEQELESCKHQFQKKSSDPAHIRNMNKEFGHFVEIVKVATNRFLRGKDNPIY